MLNVSFSEKGLGLVSPPHFVYGFPRKMFFMLYSLTKFDCRIVFIFQDAWQYVYYNCLFTRL